MQLRRAVEHPHPSVRVRWLSGASRPAWVLRCAFTWAALSVVAAPGMGAQGAVLVDSANHGLPAHPSRWPRVTRGDVGLATAFLGGTIVLMPFDERITHSLRASSLQDSRALSSTASTFRALGDPGVLVLGLGAYGVGRLTSSGPLSDIGWHTTEAIIVSGAVSAAVKMTLGRARPYAVADSNSRDFKLGRGFHGGGAYQSLPSGHATAAFAAAAVLASEAQRRWPTQAARVGTGAFASATLVAVSRIYHDAHWASDVMLAAGIGTVAGRVLVRAHHDDRWKGIDRWVLPSGLTRGDRGELRIAWRVY